MSNATYKSESQALNKALWDEKNAWRTIESSPDVFPEIKKTIAEDDKAEQLTEEETLCKEILVGAKKGNSNTVYIGSSDVDEDSFELDPGNSVNIVISDASLVYVYGKTGDKVAALYTQYS